MLRQLLFSNTKSDKVFRKVFGLVELLLCALLIITVLYANPNETTTAAYEIFEQARFDYAIAFVIAIVLTPPIEFLIYVLYKAIKKEF